MRVQAAHTIVMMLAAALSVAGCGGLEEFYEQPDRFPCSSNSDCISGFACGPSPEDPAVRVCQRACSSNSECGGTGLCSASGTCVELDRELCSTVEGPIGEDNVVLIGGLTPQADYGDRELASVLAVREFNEAGGISGGRRLVFVGCDDGGRPEQAAAAARHLASLGAQAVIGPYFSGVLVDTFQSVLQPNGIFTISPAATSPVITGLEDDGLVWRTISSDQAQAAAMGALVLLRNPSSVLMLAKDDAYGNYLQSEVGAQLLEALTVDGYRPAKYAGVDSDMAAVAASALGAATMPEIIAIAGTSEVTDLLAALEDEVARRGLTPPRYVLSEGAKDPQLLELVRQRPELEDRLEGTDPSLLDEVLNRSFTARYLAAFERPPQTFAPNAYDAVYVVGHALSTTSGTHPGGAAIAAGVAQLVGGSRAIRTDPADIGAARMALSSGDAIDLAGTSGNLDFDLATGESGGGVTGWSVEVRGDGSTRFLTTGTFDATTGSWSFATP